MPEGLVETTVQSSQAESCTFPGVIVGTVINNLDVSGLARVQIRIPFLKDIQPWARVAVPMAGLNRGTFFIPQIGDEVLVAFNQGDPMEPFVIGSLWNNLDRPPALSPSDATNKRVIRTPLGHQIEFDDLLQSITITTNTQQTISIDPKQISLATTGRTASITLDLSGTVTIAATQSISMSAPNISVTGPTKVDVSTSGTMALNGGTNCSIKAGLITIN